MATFWEIAAHSHLVNHVLFLCLFVVLVVFSFSFRGRDFGSDCAISWFSLYN